MMTRREHGRDWLFAAALVAVVVLAYQPAWQGGFLWDDDAHVTRPELRSTEGLYHIWFTVGATQQYYPLLHSIFWVEHKLWGDWALPYHLLNILLHAAAAVMVALALRRLAVPGAYLAAAVFALHPVHVESVAWITELKNTLSAVFYLGAAIAYLRFDEERNLRWYRWALGLFVLALLTKPVTSTLPAALLVVFWWQRGRLSWQRDVRPLVPFFVLGVASGLFAAWVERKLIGAEGGTFDLTLVERCLLAGRVVWFYIGKLFWPAELLFFYPRWEVSRTAAWQYVFPAAAILLVVALWWLRRRWRGPLAGLLFFAGTLFPVLGFFNAYLFRYTYVADHFQYLASLGIIAVVSAGVAMLLEWWGLWRRPVGYVLCLGLLAVLGGLTFHQSRMYADIDTLYRTTINKNPTCWIADNNLGQVLAERGESDGARDLFEKALKLNPDYPEAHSNLGTLLMNRGRVVEGLAHLGEAVRLEPELAKWHNKFALALGRLGRMDEAEDQLQKALKINPRHADARQGLSVVQSQKEKMLDALAGRRSLLESNPKDVVLLNDPAWLLATAPNASLLNGIEAVELAQRAVKLSGGKEARMLDTLAAAYAEAGRFSEAVATAGKALDLATQQRQQTLADGLRARLALYKVGKPYRQSFSVLATPGPTP
jgi:protein O-mannosyl-transferase